MTLRIVYGRHITVLLLLALHWSMKTSTDQEQNGIQWTPWKQLDDLVFSDDLALRWHTVQYKQEKTNMVADSENKLFKIDASNDTPFTD